MLFFFYSLLLFSSCVGQKFLQQEVIGQFFDKQDGKGVKRSRAKKYRKTKLRKRKQPEKTRKELTVKQKSNKKDAVTPTDKFSFSPDNIDARLAEHWFSHKIRKGESLSIISQKYGVGIVSLRKTNRIRGNRIYAGQSLIIPTVSKMLSQSSFDLQDMWDQNTARDLAMESYKYGARRNGSGNCLRGVRIALTKTLKKAGRIGARERLFMGSSAHRFKVWVTNNIKELCSRYGLVPIVGNKGLPTYPGLIYVYHKGSCGFNKTFGHVEVVVSESPVTLCSDNCRTLKKAPCNPDLILAPCKYCPGNAGSVQLSLD